MSSSKETAIYNVKAVVRETGLKPDTLRAWERRYGIPTPQRTESGHRLYSQRDIEIVKWLSERQREGLTISRAVTMWNQLVATGEDPFAGQHSSGQYHEAVVSSVPGNTVPLAETNGQEVASLRQDWVNACLRFDERTGERVLSQAFAYLPAEVVCMQVLQHGMAEIGERWHQGRATVQQEHFASALALRRLESLVAATPPPTLPGRVIVGCPPGEEHTFVPLMLTLLLRRRGRDVIYLGGNVPLDSLAETVTVTEPDLVLLTAQQLHTAASLLETAILLRRIQTPLAYGGLVFNQLSDLTWVIPGYFLGANIASAVDNVTDILAAPRVRDAQRQVNPIYAAVREAFIQHRSAIEVEVWQQMQGHGIPQQHLAAANINVGRNIEATLTLGNMSFMGSDIQWVEALLVTHYHLPSDLLREYLRAYAIATQKNLGAEGEPIVEWLIGISGQPAPFQHQIIEADRLAQG